MNEDLMRNFVSKFKWIWAKTYEKFAPHEYIVVKHNHPDRKTFEEVVKFIRKNGFKAKFGRKTFTYFILDGYKYWTMGDSIDNTWILNRAKLNYE